MCPFLGLTTIPVARRKGVCRCLCYTGRCSLNVHAQYITGKESVVPFVLGLLGGFFLVDLLLSPPAVQEEEEEEDEEDE